MTNEEKENLSALANLMGVIGSEMKFLDNGYIEKPSTGSGVEIDVNQILRQQASSGSQVQNKEFLDSNSRKFVPSNKSPVHQIVQSPTILPSTEKEKEVIEELQAIKEILNRINNNIGKISGMAGKIFSNLNNPNKL